MRILAFVLAMSLIGIAPSVAQDPRPSFDCARASTAVEKAVCASQELSALDRALDGRYRGAQQALQEGALCLQQEQREWARTRNACGPDAGCLKTRYRERIAALNGLQPGARHLRSDASPSVPSLVAALPPRPDSGKEKAGPPVEHRGALVHEVEDTMNMGFAIRSADGKAHVLLLEMDLDGGRVSTSVESALRTGKGTTFLVKGFAGEHGGLAMSRCRLLYRLPGE